jgi:hypothetical protein
MKGLKSLSFSSLLGISNREGIRSSAGSAPAKAAPRPTMKTSAQQHDFSHLRNIHPEAFHHAMQDIVANMRASRT